MWKIYWLCNANISEIRALSVVNRLGDSVSGLSAWRRYEVRVALRRCIKSLNDSLLESLWDTAFWTILVESVCPVLVGETWKEQIWNQFRFSFNINGRKWILLNRRKKQKTESKEIIWKKIMKNERKGLLRKVLFYWTGDKISWRNDEGNCL